MDCGRGWTGAQLAWGREGRRFSQVLLGKGGRGGIVDTRYAPARVCRATFPLSVSHIITHLGACGSSVTADRYADLGRHDSRPSILHRKRIDDIPNCACLACVADPDELARLLVPVPVPPPALPSLNLLIDLPDLALSWPSLSFRRGASGTDDRAVGKGRCSSLIGGGGGAIC